VRNSSTMCFDGNNGELCILLGATYTPLSWILIVLVHWNSSRIDMSPHSDTLSWFWANQSLLFLLSDASLAEKQQIPSL